MVDVLQVDVPLASAATSPSPTHCNNTKFVAMLYPSRALTPRGGSGEIDNPFGWGSGQDLSSGLRRRWILWEPKQCVDVQSNV